MDDWQKATTSRRDKDLSRDGVCLSGAVIQTVACLIYWLCSEFTDSLMEISRLRHDLRHQETVHNPPHPQRKAQGGSCEPVSGQIAEPTRDTWVPRIHSSIWSVACCIQIHHLFLIELASYCALPKYAMSEIKSDQIEPHFIQIRRTQSLTSCLVGIIRSYSGKMGELVGFPGLKMAPIRW